MAKSQPTSTSDANGGNELPVANPPVFVTRHRALKAAVWRNESDNGPFFSVTVTRGYKVGESWRESTSFGFDDVLIIAELLRTCHGFISGEIAKAGSAAAR